MDLQLDNKVAFISASTKGLGRESACRLVEEGASVTISSRDERHIAKAREYILDQTNADPSDVLALICDVTERDEVRDAVEETVDTYGGLDVMVNNHGGVPATTFAEASREQWDRAYKQVIESNVAMAEAALPHLDESEHGALITITSSSAREPPENHIFSNVFRLGLYGLTKSIAKEYAPSVRANCVSARYVMTDQVRYMIERRAEHEDISIEAAEQARNDEVLLDRPGNPAEFADAVAFVASPRASYITGEIVSIDGGWTRSVL
jgi:NAD(P)-dependent dehydrogenase (short-subunit alcohol dehydrogenase family)